MMRCETCSHECTVVDFVTLRNVCEHLYLDSVAKKHNPFLASTTGFIYSGNAFQHSWPKAIECHAAGPELLPLE